MGFRKILKKWDKRSRSTTKELYLSRQVEVQPVFNRQVCFFFICLGVRFVHGLQKLYSLSPTWRIQSPHVCSI